MKRGKSHISVEDILEIGYVQMDYMRSIGMIK